MCYFSGCFFAIKEEFKSYKSVSLGVGGFVYFWILLGILMSCHLWYNDPEKTQKAKNDEKFNEMMKNTVRRPGATSRTQSNNKINNGEIIYDQPYDNPIRAKLGQPPPPNPAKSNRNLDHSDYEDD